MKNIAVKTSMVNKGFGQGESRTEVLKEVNFEARMGELLMLVGPSGCGKTTLLSVIAGTLGTDRGEVEVFDSPLHQMDKKSVTQFRAANIGFIFQQYNLIPTLNVDAQRTALQAERQETLLRGQRAIWQAKCR